ncbi:MAG TPA: hypothetical protein DCQ31_07955 [Bacteroidales bacterium]|nr:hypothetical protein [Bacteroidales bacterium]
MITKTSKTTLRKTAKRTVTKRIKRLPNELREVEVTYSQGDVVSTSMSASLTAKDIRDYFKIGRVFNIGRSGKDFLDKIVKVKILK